jgi:hypothetical protein
VCQEVAERRRGIVADRFEHASESPLLDHSGECFIAPYGFVAEPQQSHQQSGGRENGNPALIWAQQLEPGSRRG